MHLPSPPNAPSLQEASRYWFKLGWLSFGGPAGQISMMHDELVERRAWISSGRFSHALNYTMLLPGPEAQQLATYIGWLLHGTRGGIIAGLLFILPSLLILIALSWAYLRFGQLGWVAGLLYGIKPAVVAIVLHAAWRLGQRNLHNMFFILLAVFSFIAIFFFSLPFPWIVLCAALLGGLAAYFRPEWWEKEPAQPVLQRGHSVAKPVSERAGLPQLYLHDDDSPLPTHAFFCRRHTLGYLLIGVCLWLLGVIALVHWQSISTQTWVASLPDMAGFFTKAALVTFGGAYAVLPYVFQAAVSQYNWLTAAQMIDGLALGESTPGPLIMVLAFVGYLATAQLAAPEEMLIAGTVGASVVCFFTFLPSFLFILVGAPIVEASRSRLRWRGPLSAISAAVVGVIVNLALVFAGQVLWPGAGPPFVQRASTFGESDSVGAALAQALGAIDPIAVALILFATFLLHWQRWHVFQLLLPCACLGLLIHGFLR